MFRMTKTPLINGNLLHLAFWRVRGRAAGSRALSPGFHACGFGAIAHAPALLDAYASFVAMFILTHKQCSNCLQKNFIITNHGASMTLQTNHSLSNHEIDSCFHLRLHNV